ncbi:MAG: TPM domain-containing protein [Treponema sp.]|nr:TPM domain-containing protein [Treponema sp.]MBR0487306.1 TPM domain-containing protein [Treponema sp.]
MKKLILLLLLCTPLYANIPALSGRIIDNANIIDAETEATLTESLAEFENSTGIQIAVLTVASLGNYATIEEFAQEVFDEWKLGQAKQDNGLLLCVSFAEKKIRIQTGYGLEGTLTDTKCGIIIRRAIAPFFKEENYSEGITNGIDIIIRYLKGDEEIRKTIDSEKGGSKAPLIPFVMWFIFIAIVIISNIRARKNGHIYPGTGSGGPFDGHHRRGGGFGGGFGGGGGFSGGGGRSGGGGATGGW